MYQKWETVKRFFPQSRLTVMPITPTADFVWESSVVSTMPPHRCGPAIRIDAAFAPPYRSLAILLRDSDPQRATAMLRRFESLQAGQR